VQQHWYYKKRFGGNMRGMRRIRLTKVKTENIVEQIDVRVNRLFST
jgi:hypothetical protein